MSIDFQLTTWRYIPEDRTLHNHRCENLKSHLFRKCSRNETPDVETLFFLLLLPLSQVQIFSSVSCSLTALLCNLLPGRQTKFNTHKTTGNKYILCSALFTATRPFVTGVRWNRWISHRNKWPYNTKSVWWNITKQACSRWQSAPSESRH
jgi:hypothetical protein